MSGSGEKAGVHGDRTGDMEKGGARQWDPGSFRDRTSRVFHREGAVFRSLSAEALADWERLRSAGWFEALQAAGKIVRTRRVDTAADATGEATAGPMRSRREDPEPARPRTPDSAHERRSPNTRGSAPPPTPREDPEPARPRAPDSTRERGSPDSPNTRGSARPSATMEPRWVATLAHETIPFVSYPGFLTKGALNRSFGCQRS